MIAVSLAVVVGRDLVRVEVKVRVRAFGKVVDEIARPVQDALQQSFAGRDLNHRHRQMLKGAAAVVRGVSSVVLEPSLEEYQE